MKRLIFIALLPLMMAGCENETNSFEENIRITYEIIDSDGNVCDEFHTGDTVTFICRVTNLNNDTLYYDEYKSHASAEFGYIYSALNDSLIGIPSIWMIGDGFPECGAIAPRKSQVLLYADYPEYYDITLSPGEYYTEQKPKFAYYQTNCNVTGNNPLTEMKTETLTVKFRVL